MKNLFSLIILLFSSLVGFAQNNFTGPNNTPAVFRYLYPDKPKFNGLSQIQYQVEGFDGINFYGNRLTDENKDGKIDIVYRAINSLEGDWDLVSTNPRIFVYGNIDSAFNMSFNKQDMLLSDGRKYLYHSDNTGDYYYCFFWGDPTRISEIGVTNWQEFYSQHGYELGRDYYYDTNQEFIEYVSRIIKVKDGIITDVTNDKMTYSAQLDTTNARYSWDQVLSNGDFDHDGDTDIITFASNNFGQNPNFSTIYDGHKLSLYYYQNKGNGNMSVEILPLVNNNDKSFLMVEGTYQLATNMDADPELEILTEYFIVDKNSNFGPMYPQDRHIGYIDLNFTNKTFELKSVLDSRDVLYNPDWGISPRFIQKLENKNNSNNDLILMYFTSQAGSPVYNGDGVYNQDGTVPIQYFKIFRKSFDERQQVQLEDVTVDYFSNNEDKNYSNDNAGNLYQIDVDQDGLIDIFPQIGANPYQDQGGINQMIQHPNILNDGKKAYYYKQKADGSYKITELFDFPGYYYPQNFDYDFTKFDDNGRYSNKLNLEDILGFNQFSINDLNSDGENEYISSGNPNLISVFTTTPPAFADFDSDSLSLGKFKLRNFQNARMDRYDFERFKVEFPRDTILKNLHSNYEQIGYYFNKNKNLTHHPFLFNAKLKEEDFTILPNAFGTELIENGNSGDLKLTFAALGVSNTGDYVAGLGLRINQDIYIKKINFKIAEKNYAPLPFDIIYQEKRNLQTEEGILLTLTNSIDINNNNYLLSNGNNGYGVKYGYELYKNGTKVKEEIIENPQVNFETENSYPKINLLVKLELDSLSDYSYKIFALDNDDSTIKTYATATNLDSDWDGLEDSSDNCPLIYNPEQKDINQNSIGDDCEKPIIYQVEPKKILTYKGFEFYRVPIPTQELDIDAKPMPNPFDRSLIPIDLNNDGLMDFMTTHGPKVNGETIGLGHMGLPLYFINNGNFNFSVYKNPNNIEYSIFHGLQNYILEDVNNDGKKEILMGGEHYHLENMIPGAQQKSFDWLANYANHVKGKDFSNTEFKLNRYYSFNEDNLMIDNVNKIDISNLSIDCEGQFNSIQSLVSGDFDKDNDIDFITMASAQCNGSIMNYMKNNGTGEFTLTRYPSLYWLSEGRMINFDINHDGYEDIIGIGNNNNPSEGFAKTSDIVYFLNDQSGNFDFNQPTVFEKITQENNLSKSLRSYKIIDLNNDGIKEIIIYTTNLYSTIGGDIIYDDSLRTKLEPLNFFIVLTTENNSLKNVTNTYIDDLAGFDKIYYNASSALFEDINGDGYTDIFPWAGHISSNPMWNNDDIGYFQWDNSNKKFKFRNLEGFNSFFNDPSRSGPNGMYNGMFQKNKFDLIDLDQDGQVEFVRSDGDSLSIFKNIQLEKDSDGDLIFDYQDNCPLIANPEQTDINSNKVGDICETPPTAIMAEISTKEETSVSYILKGYDLQNDTLSFKLIDSPLNGSIQLVDSTISYTPNKDFTGIDTFSFVVNDKVNDSEKATVSIEVENVNDAPSGLINTSFSIAETASIGDIIDTLRATDIDSPQLSFLILDGNQGNILGTQDSLLTLQAALDFENTPNYSFTIGVFDGQDTTQSTLNIQVINVPNQSISLPMTINVYDVANENGSIPMVYKELTAKLESGLIYTISGGADKDLFTIDPNTGKINFITTPDFENPTDANHDNAYEIIVTIINKTDGDAAPVKIPAFKPFNVPEAQEGVTENIEAYLVEQDADTDGDTILDKNDNCLIDPNQDQKDTDKDGFGDVCDDSDGDGIADATDASPNTPAGEIVDATGTSEGQKDNDNDGVINSLDKCIDTPAGTQVGQDGCELILAIKETAKFSAYPNPFKDYITIHFDKAFGEKVNVTIYNFAGQKIVEKDKVINGEKINLKKLAPGNFLLKLQSLENINLSNTQHLIKE